MSALKAGLPLFIYQQHETNLVGPDSRLTPEILDTLRKNRYTNIDSNIKKFEAWQDNPGFKPNKRKKK